MDIRFHIPDFTRHFKVNMLLIKVMQQYPQYFRDNVKIGSVYGEFPTSLWGGGRNFGGSCDKDYIKSVLKYFNDLGIPCRFTYSNPLITKEHLSDKHCNMCMNLANNGLNEVIVVSDILEDYIRKNYPAFPIISSTCKEIRDAEALNAELEKDYKYVVLDYNRNNDFEFLEKVPHKEKCELLVNACCIPNCKRRGEHYKHIGKRQIDYCKSLKTGVPFPPDSFTCPYMNNTLYQTTGYSTHIKPDDIYEKYVPMGFNNFKLEGRAFHHINLIENYAYYLAKPEHRDEMRFLMLMSINQNRMFVE